MALAPMVLGRVRLPLMVTSAPEISPLMEVAGTVDVVSVPSTWVAASSSTHGRGDAVAPGGHCSWVVASTWMHDASRGTGLLSWHCTCDGLMVALAKRPAAI